MIKGIGTDIVDLTRLNNKGDRFIKRVLSDEEYAFYRSINDDDRRLTFLGGRFAAKEALSKALSKGNGKTNYKDFSILNDLQGKPYIENKPVILDGYNIHLSIAHTDAYAIAYVILEMM